MQDIDKETTPSEESTYVKEAIQAEIGVKLQQAREEKKLSKDYIIKELKFNAPYLDALESGDWKELPGEVYAIGFLKQYAALVSLNVSSDIERIKSNDFEMTTPVTYPDEKTSPHKLWAAAAILLFILLIIIFNMPDSDAPHKESITPTTVQPVAIDIDRYSNLSSDTTPILNKDYQKGDELSLETHITPAEQYLTKEPTNPNLPIKDTVQEKEAPTLMEASYSFYASTNDVWLQVFKANGPEPELLKEALLKKGQRLNIKSKGELLLTAGNSRALEVLKNGEVLFAVDTLGREGRVLKRFSISP